VSGDQFAAIIGEADLKGSVMAVLGLVDDLRGVDMGKSKLLGGKIRVLVETGLERVEELLELCRELASFDPDGAAAELRETPRREVRMPRVPSVSSRSADRRRLA
jgi:hypothetical protein